MNILEQVGLIEGLPDAALMKEASAPSGQVPQFLVVSEIKRRSDMRKRYQEQQQQPQGTVKDQILAEAMGGIAPMMPTAMTPPAQPMGPAGPPPNGAMRPPMGGMPPQGAPPMAPPMPQGMPPMPMGGIASAPQAMPPMGMAQGGIVRMQEGGQPPNDSALRLRSILASNPGITFAELMSMGFTQADLDRLSNLGYQERIDSERILGDAISGLERVDPEMRLSKTIPTEVRPASDIYGQSAVTRFAGDVSRAAQENMPQYSMISPAAGDGMGSALSSLDDAVGGGITSVFSGVPQYSIPDPNSPSSVFSRSAGNLMQQSLDEAAGRRQGLMDLLTGKLRYKPESIALLEAEQAGDITRGERKLALSGADQTPEKEGVAGLFGTGFGGADYSQAPDVYRTAGVKEGVEETPVSRAVTELSNYPSRDESNPFLDQVQGTLDAARKITGDISVQGTLDAARKITGDISVQGQSEIQTQPTPASKAPSDVDMPALDFSDLIAEGKQQALANAMIQLGAGVASGDVAKGLSAAGTAAMEGTADARALDMRRRLAEYQAGREDIRRGEEADRFERQMRLQERKVDISESQFTETLDQASDKLDAEITKAGRVSKGQLLTFVADIVQESLRNYVPEEGESMEEVAAALSDQLLRKYAGFMDVDVSGLPAIGGTQTGSRSREDILAQYNVAN